MVEFETAVAQAIQATSADGQSPKHDVPSRWLLEIIPILTRILKELVEEYKDCTLEEIESLIGPNLGDKESVLPGNRPERIHGMDTHDKTPDEKEISYDLLFRAELPGSKGNIGLIINIESQYKFKLDYPLVKREIFYAVRLLSSEHDRDIGLLDYGNIKRVYSIWICTNPSEECHNTITQFHMTQKNIVGDYVEPVENYDLMRVIQVELGGPEEKNYNGILRMLDVIFAEKSRLSPEEKKRILHDDYGIPMTRELEEGLITVCNLSDVFFSRGETVGEARGEAKGESRGRAEKTDEMIRNFKALGVPLETIAQGSGMSLEYVQALV